VLPNQILLVSKLNFLPNPSISTQRNQVTYGGQSPSNLPATNLSLTQPLLLGGDLIAGYNKADARLSAADYALLETREDVVKRVVTAYAEWQKAYLKILAMSESVKIHENLAGMITRRYEAGVASGSDRDLGNSRLYQALSELDTQKSIEASALTSLSQLVGEEVSRKDLIGNLAKPKQLPRRSEGISTAQANSVTVQRYKYESEAAQQEAKQIRGQALPQLSFQAQRQIGNAYVPGYPGYNAVGLVVQFSPGGGFSTVAGTRAAFERADAATHQVEAAKRDLNDRLNADYNEYEFSLLKRDSLQKSVDLSGDISASYDRQYLVGKKSWLDLMNAVRERAQAQLTLADVEGSLLASSYRLYVFIRGSMTFDSVGK
jgi:adhesin transport system outer membrane protein